MSRDRARGRREFRPTLDGRLEPKILLSGSHRAAQHRGGRLIDSYYFQTAFGGKIVEITAPDGGIFDVSVLNGGAIRALPVPKDPLHRVDLYVYNSNASSVLTVDPRGQIFSQHDAHDFNVLNAKANPYLNIRNINLISRTGQTQIGQVLGYHSATFSGTLNVTSSAPVDRIAFEAIGPGTKVSLGGDLNTLDVVENFSLGAGDYFRIGRDLNATQIGGDITLNGGAQFTIGRDFGANLQAAKGSEPAYPLAQTINTNNVITTSTLNTSGVINGSINIDPQSAFVIGRRPDNILLIHGAINGVQKFSVNGVQGSGSLAPFILPNTPVLIQLYGGAPPFIGPQPPQPGTAFVTGTTTSTGTTTTGTTTTGTTTTG